MWPPSSLRQGEREWIDCVGCFKEPGVEAVYITPVYVLLTFMHHVTSLSAKEAEKCRGAHEF